jgi:tetratricopeptide (TPR) repeat protein
MMTMEDKMERIHRYLLQEMSPDERTRFEADCTQDPELAAALDLERKLIAAIQQHGAHQIRSEVKRVVARERRKRTTLLLLLPVMATVAAGVALLIIFNLRPADEFYLPPPRNLYADDSKGSASDETIMKQAVAAYDREAYDTANALLAQYPDTGKAAIRAHFLRGHCLYALDSASKAANQFKFARDSAPENSKMKRYAWWYLVLALQKQGDIPAAKTELDHLRETQLDKMDADLRDRVKKLKL